VNCIAFCDTADTTRSALDLTVDIAQIVGAIGAVIAIVYAVQSARIGRRALEQSHLESARSILTLIHERRIQFDLYDAVSHVDFIRDATGPARVRVAGLVGLVGFAELPITMAAADMGDRESDVTRMVQAALERGLREEARSLRR